MRNRYLWSLLAVAAGVLVPSSGSAQQFEWKFKEGEKFYLESQTKNKQTIKVMGMEIPQDIEQTSVTSFNVQKKNADGSVVIEQKIETMKSTGAEAQGVGDIMKEMEGTTFRLTLSPKMQITKFEGYDALVKKLAEKNPALGGMIRNIINEDMLKKTAEEAFSFLPDKAVKVGDKWTKDVSMPLGPMGHLKGTNSYTLKDLANGKASIDVASDLKYSPPEKNAGGLPFEITKGELKIDEVKGSLEFDTNLGKLTKSEMKLKMKGSFNLSAMGQNITMDMEQDQTVKSRLLDKAPSGN